MTSSRESSKSLYTRMRIFNAIDKPIDRITVNEICAKAGVSRQTFYNTFDSKHSVISWWSACCEPFFLDKIGFDYSWEEGTLRHMRLLYTKIGILGTAMLEHSSDVQREVSLRRQEVLKRSLREKQIEIDDLLEFCVTIYADNMTETATTIGSLLKNKKKGLVAATKMMLATVPAPLYASLQPQQFAKESQLERLNKVERIFERVLDEPEPDVFDLIRMSTH